MRPSKSLVPNTITILAVFFGYLSILETINENYLASAVFIMVAGILDMLDGRVARMMNASSPFGVQFDSLADVVNYGVAPSLLFYYAYFYAWGTWGIALSFLPMACVAVRLARYTAHAKHDAPTASFQGLPSTIAAMVMASFVLFAHVPLPYQEASFGLWALLLVVMLSLLMVSDVRYDKSLLLPRKRKPSRWWVAWGALALAVMLLPQVTFFLWSMSYVLWGVVKSAFGTLRYEMTKGR
jgi:CDP-diacylglycerol--serine O-phosphatidyltransferase